MSCWFTHLCESSTVGLRTLGINLALWVVFCSLRQNSAVDPGLLWCTSGRCCGRHGMSHGPPVFSGAGGACVSMQWWPLEQPFRAPRVERADGGYTDAARSRKLGDERNYMGHPCTLSLIKCICLYYLLRYIYIIYIYIFGIKRDNA